MPAFICTACGTQYPPSDAPPAHARSARRSGNTCRRRPELDHAGEARGTHFNAFRQHEDGLIGIGTQPPFAIGQRALRVHPNGNVLWDCIALLDDATVTLIKGLGGLKAIAISHPHFYTTMVEWARVRRAGPSPRRRPQMDHAARSRDQALGRRHAAAHAGRDADPRRRAFPGGTMLHWAKGAGGGVLSADIATVTQDRKFLTFMRSYPNFIPLSAREVEASRRRSSRSPSTRSTATISTASSRPGRKKSWLVFVDRYLSALNGAYDSK